MTRVTLDGSAVLLGDYVAFDRAGFELVGFVKRIRRQSLFIDVAGQVYLEKAGNCQRKLVTFEE